MISHWFKDKNKIRLNESQPAGHDGASLEETEEEEKFIIWKNTPGFVFLISLIQKNQTDVLLSSC